VDTAPFLNLSLLSPQPATKSLKLTPELGLVHRAMHWLSRPLMKTD
jgi:hypothetical protein